MPEASVPVAYVRLLPGVFVRNAAAAPTPKPATAVPEVADTRASDAGASDTGASDAGGADRPVPTPGADARVEAQTEAQTAVLDQVRAGLVRDAQEWAARVVLLRRWQALPHPDGERFDQLELAGSWQISQLTATSWLDEAERLGTCLPMTLAGLAAGTLLVHQAKVLLHRTRHVAVEVARAVDAAVVPTASALCPGDLRRRVDRTVLEAEATLTDPATTEQRHADEVADRRTFTRPEPDGMGLAGAVLPAVQLAAWQQGLDQLERLERVADRAAGVDRTADQRRADLFAALPAMVLAGTAQDDAQPGTDLPRRPWTLGPEQLAAQVVLHVHVPVATVLELSQQPGTLDRYGPLSAQHVRLVRPHSLRRVLVDATTGVPVAVDDRVLPVSTDRGDAAGVLRRRLLDLLVPTVVVDRDEPQHDPSAGLARLVDVRDVHCCGPGCSSTRTDRDHLRPHPQGPTSADNLGRVSRRCHRAKHHGWTLVRHPDGSATWTSPLGRTYGRPAPHHPPPSVDLWDDPLPPRPRPVGRASLSVPDRPPGPPAAAPGGSQPSSDPPGRDDDPPPF